MVGTFHLVGHGGGDRKRKEALSNKRECAKQCEKKQPKRNATQWCGGGKKTKFRHGRAPHTKPEGQPVTDMGWEERERRGGNEKINDEQDKGAPPCKLGGGVEKKKESDNQRRYRRSKKKRGGGGSPPDKVEKKGARKDRQKSRQWGAVGGWTRKREKRKWEELLGSRRG